MAGEEVSVIPSTADNNKRKLEEIEPTALDLVAEPAGSNGVQDGAVQVDDVVESDAKRPRLGDGAAGLEAHENGSQEEIPEEQHDSGNPKSEEPNQENLETQESDLLVDKTQGTKTEETEGPTRTEEIRQPTIAEETQGSIQTEETHESTQIKETQEPTQTGDIEVKTVDIQEDPATDSKIEDHQDASTEDIYEANKSQVDDLGEIKETSDSGLQTGTNETVSITRKIDVPGSKVGVLIGKGGETIKYLQYNSGAKIQILRDAEADPDSTTRPVELIGSLSSIEKAEKLIQAVITEAEAGGSPSLLAKGLAGAQAAGGAEQIEMPIPFDKVGLIIGRRGETIKSMQSKSGARIQLIQENAEGPGSKEKTIRICGNKMQIEIATEMIKDVMNQISRPPSMSGGYNQPHYRPRGPSGPPHWGSRGPHGGPPMPYDYNHRGPYPPQNSHYNPPPYGGYPPQHMPPRGGYGASWDQRPPHSGGYDYYGRQGSHNSGPVSAPASGHGPGPFPSPNMGGPTPPQGNYSYGQSHSSDYGHGGQYNQTAPPQNYGHMYEQPKYDTPPPVHQPYGGGSQPGYPPAGGQPGYNQPQQHAKPYGMQGPGPQGYGPPRPATPNDMSYQGMTPSAQSYGPSATPQQQQYQYASSGPMQQTYPSYPSGAPSDGYSQQAPPATAPPAYQQQGAQPSYGQQATSGGYGSYPSSQQAYTEQPAQHNGSYGYQGTQDPSYGGGSGAAYAAAPTGGQQAYPQATQAQPGYDQSAAGYAAAPGNVPAKSPQPGGYPPQYDANQVYAAPR